MKSISIYAITRNQNTEQLQKLERHLSGREKALKIREWELGSLKALVRQLEIHMPEVPALRLFYSFQIPRLGKEFDLLQIKENQIVNIELKSGVVSDEAMRKQLLQNRYYLSALGKPIRSYTYNSSQNRLVRLTNHDHIADTEWEQLCRDLQDESDDYKGNIEELFRAELYLISPLTEPARFLKNEYFLTSQQRDIERQILKRIRAKQTGYFWFSGLPGTGKTLLLYDISMKLSKRQQVCMIHCGEAGREWKSLHERLQRVIYLSDSQITPESRMECYSAILVDEAHLLSADRLRLLMQLAGDRPMIFSSDCETMISPEELDQGAMRILEELPDIQTFRLTNRIRTNVELSLFIRNMMCLCGRKNPRQYPHIAVLYANDEREAEALLRDYAAQGYGLRNGGSGQEEEAERLAFLLDDRYYYDEGGYLRSTCRDVRHLFHQLNCAKEELALVVKGNEAVYAALLDLL